MERVNYLKCFNRKCLDAEKYMPKFLTKFMEKLPRCKLCILFMDHDLYYRISLLPGVIVIRYDGDEYEISYTGEYFLWRINKSDEGYTGNFDELINYITKEGMN